MFKMFKSNQQPEYPPVVVEIHNEFECAADALLREAQEIINSTPKVGDKANRLAAMGFTKVPEVAKAKEAEQKQAKSMADIESVRYYSMKYPNHKFITESQVIGICEKYDLVFGPSHCYTGFVPDKNLREIETFKLRDEDVVKYELRNRAGMRVIFLNSEDVKWVEDSDIFEGYLNNGEGVWYSGAESQVVFTRNGGRQIPNVVNEPFMKIHRADQGFMICAPLKDMDTTGLRVNGRRVLREIPDPVVLCPVRGGYLVVTKWGPEASDPEVVDQRNN